MSPSGRWSKPSIPDSSLDPFREGVGELLRDGQVVGHLASSVSEFRTLFSPRRLQWWVWLVAIWPDGTRENSIEDYPPWTYVDDMRHGFIECEEWRAETRGRYDFRWIPKAEAHTVREALSITPSDF